MGCPDVLTVPVRAVETGSSPLSDGLALVLRKRGKHLEDEPAGWVGGVYGLGGAPQGHTRRLEPVVGIHDDKQRAAQPVQLVDEHHIELTRLGVV